MSEEKNNERDAAVEAFLKTVMASAAGPAEPAAKTAEAVPAAAETAAAPVLEAEAEPAPEEEDVAPEAAPVLTKVPTPAAAATTRAAMPKMPIGPRKFGAPAAGTQSVMKKPVPAPGGTPRPETQKTQMAGMKSGSFPVKSAPAKVPPPVPAAAAAPDADADASIPLPVSLPVPAPVHAAAPVVKAAPKHSSPIPLLNLIVSVVLLIMFLLLLIMMASLKGSLARQDKALGKLQESIDNVGTIAKIKFGVVQDPKRGLLGVFIDGKDPTRYKVVDLKEER